MRRDVRANAPPALSLAAATPDLLNRLRPRERCGSKPRCHLRTHGDNGDAAARLTALAAPFATVAVTDRWRPRSFVEREEAQFHQAAGLLDPALGSRNGGWPPPAGMA